jgi:DNA modification methylase
MMKPYYQDLHNTLYCMDFRVNDLPDESVQAVVTSPPYWGLRKYSGEQELIWGGDPNCDHEWDAEVIEHDNLRFRGEHSIVGSERNPAIRTGKKIDTGVCLKCGATKSAFGLEKTPEEYIQHTIKILREIRRVLRKDGVVFWNIGDSYSPPSTHRANVERGGLNQLARNVRNDMKFDQGILKPKDLCLIPFRVAIAAQEDGWWVRSVIIWSKPNPMPESVTDRPTESHEYILMLTKSKKYYWDADAVREPVQPSTIERYKYPNDGGSQKLSYGDSQFVSRINPIIEKPGHKDDLISQGRNIRSVWEFPTQPYPEAHFAVFPEKLPEICIKAASKENDLILDPFAGAGTSLWVAKTLNRKAVGYELSEEYVKLAVERIRQQVLL